ncbi:hypothetical protein N825_02460 [Skermanella stibiiresistens SB22]|uniref:Uncharacterized protein n=1 Tax=Skermanella stibiiresistens SB22 TaxID=1385369 RepID=W9HDS9_9PROT|nr:hypothetical protein [Skermanella stibiiresistens]EWY42881.1 hypothetical protein N825_02460 [Skermanella stibiiresistens SB22]
MTTKLNQALIDEFTTLVGDDGIRDVSHWTLPNDDIRFVEEVALAEFDEQLDEAFAVTSTAIDGIVGAKK